MDTEADAEARPADATEGGDQTVAEVEPEQVQEKPQNDEEQGEEETDAAEGTPAPVAGEEGVVDASSAEANDDGDKEAGAGQAAEEAGETVDSGEGEPTAEPASEAAVAPADAETTPATAVEAEDADAPKPPPSASPTSIVSKAAATEDDEDDEDTTDGEDDDDEAADSAGELRPIGAAAGNINTNDDDDDDTKSDASGQNEADEETATAEAEEDVGGQLPLSPRSAAARERRLQTRLTSFDKRQEKFSLMKATVKTFDVSMEVVIGKWKRLREDYIKLRSSSVLASGDDGSLMITRRMTEIGNMCSRTTNAAFYLATLPEAVQDVIKKMTNMPRDVFREARRRDWSQYDRFVYAARMARVLAQACLVRRKLTTEALANGRSLSEKDLNTNSMSKNLRDCMSYCPEFRTKEMRQKILWFLRTNKVYTHLFSSEMEEECTKFVFYEKYQDGRILSLCDRLPEKFYYVIAGKIERRKTYELRAGDYDRVFSVITKGHTSDVEQMELQKPKKFTLVASGVTEVLTLGREDFFHLLKGTGGLPLKFLQGIGIFQEFPCEKFLTSPEAISTRYFPKDRVILEDITDTPWIHVVKSGTVKVVRKQLVQHYPRNKYSQDRVIGYAKPAPSHSRTMQGLMERQRTFKADQLPTLRHGGVNPLSHTIGIVQRQQQRADDAQGGQEGERQRQAAVPRFPRVTAATVASAAAEASVEPKPTRRHRPFNMTARELQIPLRSAGSTRSGGGDGGDAWRRPLSRQRTAQVLLGPAGFPVERPQREAYVVLDTLKSGDFLGFRNITALIEGRIVRDKENVNTLLSDGAEIIRISKRFFVQHAANNTMLKAETMTREFASQEEASLSIDAKEGWDMFRAAFIRRMVAQNREAKERQFGVM